VRRCKRKSSRTTHGAGEGPAYCERFARLLRMASLGTARSHLLRDEPEDIPPRPSGYVVDSFHPAVHGLGRTENFRDGCLMAKWLARITAKLAFLPYGWSG
jgi:hypothetical protein